MPTLTPEQEIAALKEALAKQQQEIDMLKRQTGADIPRGGRTHWKRMLILAAVVLGFGSVLAYKYYLILKSITDQYPS